MLNYLYFIRKNTRLLAFGFTMACFSAFGQTFFIALFGAEFRGEFTLSNSQFGAIYSTATLISALTLMAVGRLIDRTSPTRFAAFVCCGLATSCLIAAGAPNALFLGVALFGLRLFGQGLMTHTAMTTMARRYDRHRGKAISLAGIGVPVGEGILPVMVVSALAFIDWRLAWISFAVVMIFLVLPLAMHTGRGAPDESDPPDWRKPRKDERPGAPSARSADEASQPRGFTSARDFTSWEVIRDVRFMLLLPTFIAAPFISTGIMFHQVVLVDQKGWSLTWYAATFSAFAASTVISAIALGNVVDRIGTVRMLPFYNFGLAAGCAALATVSHPVAALIYMILAGVTVGGQMLVGSALWPEMFGRKHLGAIRSLTMSLMIIGTAGSPFAFGWLIDRGITVATLAAYCALYILCASAIALIGARHHHRHEAAHALQAR